MIKKTSEQLFDELLVRRILTGDKRPLNLLVKRWHSKLLKFAYHKIKDQHMAEDLTQECWMTIIKRLHTLKDPALFGIWALRIVNYKSIDLIRSRQRIREAKKNLASNQDPVNNEEDYLQNEPMDILAILRKLPDNHQEILRLHYLENLSVAEIAFIQDIPPGTVKSRLYNARNYLRSHLKQQTDEKI